MATVFAMSIKQHLVIEKNVLQHIKEHHCGEMGDKSYFTEKPIKTIRNGMKKCSEWYGTRERKKVLCVTHMDSTIGYDPRSKKWCDTLLLVVVLARTKHRIITAYPIPKIHQFYGKLQLDSLRKGTTNK